MDLSPPSSQPRQSGLHAGLRARLFQLEVLGGLPHLGQDVPGGDRGEGREGSGGVPAGGRWRWVCFALRVTLTPSQTGKLRRADGLGAGPSGREPPWAGSSWFGARARPSVTARPVPARHGRSREASAACLARPPRC